MTPLLDYPAQCGAALRGDHRRGLLMGFGIAALI
jgi:hypothetical protein